MHFHNRFIARLFSYRFVKQNISNYFTDIYGALKKISCVYCCVHEVVDVSICSYLSNLGNKFQLFQDVFKNIYISTFS